MVWMTRVGAWMLPCLLLVCGCEKEAPAPAYKPREEPKFDQVAATTQPGTQPSTAMNPHGSFHGSNFHGVMSAPADAIHRGLGAMSPQAPANALELAAPPEWVEKPARMMTTKIYALPKAEGDAEDGDVAISFLDKDVSLDMNVQRWCTHFNLGEGRTCAQAAQQQKLEGTKHPTTIVEINGTYVGGGPMMGPQSPPKPNYVMLAAEIVKEGRRWYVKLVGPKQTVDRWRESFMQVVREAK